jgi:hypothetical protein
VYLKGLATLVHSQQVSHKLSRHLQGRAIGMAALQCVGMQCRQLRVPAGRQFGGFDQHGLQPRIALFGNGATLLLPAEERKAAVKPQ